MIKALIFDCFGVLYIGSRDYLYQQTAESDHQTLADLNQASDYGYITDADYLDQVGALTSLTPDGLKQLFASSHHPNNELIDLIRNYKKTYKVGLLSNVGSGVMERMFSTGEQAELFDGVVLSAEVGMVKPNLEIYQLMADRLDLRPEECLMIDDMPANVEGAKIAGMSGVVFNTTGSLQIALANLKQN